MTSTSLPKFITCACLSRALSVRKFRNPSTAEWVMRWLQLPPDFRASRKDVARRVESQSRRKCNHCINKLCAWRHNMPRPLLVDNTFLFIRQVAPVPACWLFKTSATSWPLILKVMSESRVTWATSANFSLPSPLFSS